MASECNDETSYLKYSSRPGISALPVGSSGPSLALSPSQSKSANHGCWTICANPFKYVVESSTELPMRVSGPAKRHDRKSIQSGDSLALVSEGIFYTKENRSQMRVMVQRNNTVPDLPPSTVSIVKFFDTLLLDYRHKMAYTPPNIHT